MVFPPSLSSSLRDAGDDEATARVRTSSARKAARDAVTPRRARRRSIVELWRKRACVFWFVFAARATKERRVADALPNKCFSYY